jgi:hypothetical protein
MGGGSAQRPVWRVNEPKKTGARMRVENPLLYYKKQELILVDGAGDPGDLGVLQAVGAAPLPRGPLGQR